ncbi:helix-turn-helix domain-containing protein, partial [Escherichia coli]
MEKPQQTPEGKAIASRQRALGISTRAAARKVGLSEARWRQIVNGYQNVGQGLMVPVIGPAETVARMARSLDLSSEYFQEIGREDVAAEMVG